MKSVATQELYAYWNSLRGARAAPRRDEIDPIAIPHSLADVFLLELKEGGRIAVRLAGTRLCDLYGRELRGSSASSLWTPSSRSEIDKVLRDVMAESAVAVVAAVACRDGRELGAFELVVTPLSDNGGACRYILGALTPSDPRAARDIDRIDALDSRSARLSWPSGLRRDLHPTPESRPDEGRRIGRFMVYEGGLEFDEAGTSTSR